MNPDAVGLEHRPESESLAKIAPVAAVPQSPPEHDRRDQRRSQVNREYVEEAHVSGSAGRRRLQRLVAGSLAIPVKQPMPVRLAEALARQIVRHLFKRTPQAHQIAVAPPSFTPQSALVEIDHV